MRIACVLVPFFAVAVEKRMEPRLNGHPLIVYDRNAVFDASAEAGEARPGVPLRRAKACYPQAVFAAADHALYRRMFESMLEALETVAPLVEPAGLGAAYVDIRGLQGHYADEFAIARALVEAVRGVTGLLAGVGAGEGKFVARVAAALVPPGDAGVVPSGREREFLRDRDVALLPAGDEVVQRLRLLALRTLGDVAALPRSAVAAQFGGGGGRLWDLAAGIDAEPLRPRLRQESLTESLSFEAPVVATEALVMAGRQLAGRLVRRLQRRAARTMHVQLLSEGRIVWERVETFREATGDEARIAFVLKTRLSLVELSQAVDAVSVTLTGIGREAAKQAKLFSDTNPNLNQLAEAIRQLRARYGRPVVWRTEEVDPCSRHPEERRALLPYDA